MKNSWINPNFQTNSSSPKTSSRSISIRTTTVNVETKSNEKKSYSSDLLGLSTPVNGPPTTDTKVADDSNDIFGDFMSGGSTTNIKPTTSLPSATATNPTKESVETTLAQQEHDFFNQVPNEKEKAKMTKDSILALYGTAPVTNQFMQGMSSMNINDNGSILGMPMQFRPPTQPQPQQQQHSAFGMPPPAANLQATSLNSFAQFGMKQQAQP